MLRRSLLFVTGRRQLSTHLWGCRLRPRRVYSSLAGASLRESGDGQMLVVLLVVAVVVVALAVS